MDVGQHFLQVDSLPNKQVVRNIIQVPAILEPRTRSGDVIGGAFALHLN